MKNKTILKVSLGFAMGITPLAGILIPAISKSQDASKLIIEKTPTTRSPDAIHYGGTTWNFTHNRFPLSSDHNFTQGFIPDQKGVHINGEITGFTAEEFQARSDGPNNFNDFFTEWNHKNVWGQVTVTAIRFQAVRISNKLGYAMYDYESFDSKFNRRTKMRLVFLTKNTVDNATSIRAKESFTSPSTTTMEEVIQNPERYIEMHSVPKNSQIDWSTEKTAVRGQVKVIAKLSKSYEGPDNNTVFNPSPYSYMVNGLHDSSPGGIGSGFIPSSIPTLTNGEIAGISIGSIGAVAVICGIIFLMVFNWLKTQKTLKVLVRHQISTNRPVNRPSFIGSKPSPIIPKFLPPVRNVPINKVIVNNWKPKNIPIKKPMNKPIVMMK